MNLVIFALVAAVLSSLFALGVRKLFPRAGNWLAVTLATILPPLAFVPYGIFRLLSDIGAAAETTGAAPPNMVDDFAAGSETILAEGAIWIMVALPVTIAVVRWHRRRLTQ